MGTLITQPRSEDSTQTRIACCQTEIEVGDLAGNRERLREEIRAAASEGAQLVLLPELATTGYLLNDSAEARELGEGIGGPSITEWTALAAEHDIAVIGGYAEVTAGGQVYNSAVYVDATGVRANYRKVHLWGLESTIFQPGSEPAPIVEATFGRVAVMICYDLEFPEWCRIAALAGADLLAAPVAWPVSRQVAGERPIEVVKLQAAAATNRVFVAACDNAGTQRGQAWIGGSAIIDPDGYPLAVAAPGKQDRIHATGRLADARDKRLGSRNNAFADRRDDLYRITGAAINASQRCRG